MTADRQLTTDVQVSKITPESPQSQDSFLDNWVSGYDKNDAVPE